MVAIVLLSLPATTAAEPEFMLVEGDFNCAPNSRLMSPSFAQQHAELVCGVLQDWSAARLSGNRSITGPALNCEISEVDHRNLGHSLCIPLKDYSSIRGVLLQSGFRSQAELNAMSHEDWRAVLITALANRTAQNSKFYDRLDNAALAGAGALFGHLAQTMHMDATTLAQFDLATMRHSVIQQVVVQTGLPLSYLQTLSDLELVEVLRQG